MSVDDLPKQCYFGIFTNEINGIHFMTTNPQSIYQILVTTHGNNIRQLIYYANGVKCTLSCQKPASRKKVIAEKLFRKPKAEAKKQ